MRTRQEIEKEVQKPTGYNSAEKAAIASLEVLLDIRDLLQNPPVENHGLSADASFMKGYQEGRADEYRISGKHLQKGDCECGNCESHL